MQVTKVFRFEAAHSLPNHDGKCREAHGHSYKVGITCEGPVENTSGHAKEGMVIDFAELKSHWRTYLEPHLDHKNLNKSLGIYTTAENIAAWICVQFLEANFPIREVTVWETESSSATVAASEVWTNGKSAGATAVEAGV